MLLSEHEFGCLDHLADERGVTASDVVRLLIRREFDAAAATPLERDGAMAAAAEQGRLRKLSELVAPTKPKK